MARPYDLRAFAYYKQGKYELAIADYTRAIERAPGLAVYLQWRGICYTRQQAYHLALADYRKATEIEPGSPRYWNSVAWLLATCPQDSLCNGKEAVKAATKACELNGWKSGFYMDTLAAAYAEDGQFDKAVEWQEKALADPELSKSVDEQEMENARLRLELYKAEKPFREHR